MKSILVVDDSATIRFAVRDILENLNFRVNEASNGQEALDFCEQQGPPDGLLLDVYMPVIDGLSFLKTLRAERRFDGVVVVMCTTETGMNRIREALACGANEYVMKPFTGDIIADKLRQVRLLE